MVLGYAKRRSNRIKSKFDHVLRAMVASGMYKVNNDGRIESTRMYMRGKNTTVSWYVCDRDDGKGYLYVSFYGYRVKAHRLAYMLYHPTAPLRGWEINHLDGNRKNNRSDNLERCDASRQSKHAFNTGLNRHVGLQHHRAKLTPATVIEMRNLRAAHGESYARLAARYSVTPRTAMLACKGETWAHIPLKEVKHG